MTPASTMTQMGFSFVFRSSNTQIPKITTILHSVPVREMLSALPQNAFLRIRIPADAIIATTAGRRDFRGSNYVMSNITVSKDGSLCYPDAKNKPQPIGITIGVFQFNNPNGLERLADSLYQQTAASGQAINEARNNNVEKSSIIQGYLESSNVQVVDEMVNMIVAQRAYELNSKAITASDEMLQQANNLRR